MKTVVLPKLYSQWDSRWSGDILGENPENSSFNLYNYGCLITCIAMMCEYGGLLKNPRGVNNDLISMGGFFHNTGYYIWGSSKRIYDVIKNEYKVDTPDLLTDAQMQQIKQALDNKKPVMVQLDVNPKTVKLDMHYVLLIGYNPNDENDFLIADPLGGVERSLKHYLGWFRPNARSTIHQYIIYDVKPSTSQSIKHKIIDWDDMEGKRHSVEWYVYEWFNEKSKRLKEAGEFKQQLIERNTKISSLSNQLLLQQKEITTCKDKSRDLSQQVSSQKILIGKLQTQNASLYDIYELFEILIQKIVQKYFKSKDSEL